MYERRRYSDNFISKILRDFYKSKQLDELSKKLDSKEFNWLLDSSKLFDEFDMLHKDIAHKFDTIKMEMREIDQLLLKLENVYNEEIFDKALNFIKDNETCFPDQSYKDTIRFVSIRMNDTADIKKRLKRYFS